MILTRRQPAAPEGWEQIFLPSSLVGPKTAVAALVHKPDWRPTMATKTTEQPEPDTIHVELTRDECAMVRAVQVGADATAAW